MRARSATTGVLAHSQTVRNDGRNSVGTLAVLLFLVKYSSLEQEEEEAEWP